MIGVGLTKIRKTMTADHKTPIYQKAFHLLKWPILGVLALGGFLDAISNSIALITPHVTYIATLILVLGWLGLEIFIKKRAIKWQNKDGSIIQIHSLGYQIRLWLVGAIVLLWVPMMIGSDISEERKVKDPLELLLGSYSVPFDQAHDIVYEVPQKLSKASFITTFIPLYIHNNSRMTVENIIITLRYPVNSKIGVTHMVKQDTIGEKEDYQITRKSGSFEGMDYTNIFIDSIGPGKTYFLAEPIELSSDMLSSSIANRISIDLSAKNITIQPLYINLVVMSGISHANILSQYKAIVYKHAVNHRKESSFWTYLKECFVSQERTVSVVQPSFRPAKNKAGVDGYISDPMHDSVGSVKYNPTPYKYLFAPLLESLSESFSWIAGRK
jgi:hypothetical protein